MKQVRLVLMALAMLIAAAGGVRAHADAALLMEEPYGTFGAFNPTGHAAIYLNHICAETPTQLRACRPGEFDVVISRYHRVAGYDWLAIPLVSYLYAVDRVEDIPTTADPELEAQLRDAYRRTHLIDIIPDISEGKDAGEAPGATGRSSSAPRTTARSTASRSRRRPRPMRALSPSSMTTATPATSTSSSTTARTSRRCC